MRISLRRRHKFLAIALLLGLAVLEVMCYMAIYHTPVGAFYFYRHSPVDYLTYIKIRDPVLGWMPLSTDDIDAALARRTPAFPDPKAQVPLVSLYGDSWTYSVGVDTEHSYANVLSRLVRRRVNNFGVPGYGSDQAYLRFKTQGEDAARIVVLGHLSANILRNVNQFYDLIASPFPVAYTFKPRFLVAGSGALELVPVPTTGYTAEQFADCVKNPEKYLAHDYFIPGGPAGVQKPGFPYLLSVLRIPRHFRFKAAMRGEPAETAFYRPGHPSNGLEVTAGIFREFCQLAGRRGKAPVIALFVADGDMRYYQKRKEWLCQPLFDRLRSLGIPYVNVGAFFVERVPSHELSNLFLPGDGHPSEEGCRLQALAVYQHLLERGLVKPDDKGAHPTSQPSSSN